MRCCVASAALDPSVSARGQSRQLWRARPLTVPEGGPYDGRGEGIGTTAVSETPQRVERLCATLVAKKATDVTVLDIATLSSVADHFVIASGRSRVAVQALADAVVEAMAEGGQRPRRTEGYVEARWICLDFGDVIVHLFQEDVRRYFDLERLWGDAPQRSVAEEAGAALGV